MNLSQALRIAFCPLLFLLFVCGCQSIPPPTGVGNIGADAVKTLKEHAKHSVNVQVHALLPERTVLLCSDNSVSILKGSQLLQTLPDTLDKDLMSKKEEVVHFLTTTDFNFDGYLDLQLTDHKGLRGNVWYNIYLYDTTAHNFRRDRDLSRVCNPEPLPDRRQVRSVNNASADGKWFTIALYDYTDRFNLRYFLNQESADDRNDVLVRTISRFEAGEETILSQIRMQPMPDGTIHSTLVHGNHLEDSENPFTGMVK